MPLYYISRVTVRGSLSSRMPTNLEWRRCLGQWTNSIWRRFKIQNLLKSGSGGSGTVGSMHSDESFFGSLTSLEIRTLPSRPILKTPIILPAREAADARRRKTSIAAKNLLADKGD
jgi:hypothetical protein